MRISPLASLVLAAPSWAFNVACPPPGAVLPAPRNPGADASLKPVLAKLKAEISSLTSKWQFSALSVGVQSIHESEPLFLQQHSPPNSNTRGASHVTPETVIRVGSISKVFTVLGLLTLPGVSFDDPVVKYLPKLLSMNTTRGPLGVTSVPWADITLGALASHIAGIGVDLAADLSNYPINFTALGLPTINSNLSVNCAGVLGIRSCNETDFYRDFENHDPVYAPFTTPVYSNIGFDILGMVIEAVSNITLEAFFDKEILKPLGLKSTAMAGPPVLDNEAFIPVGDVYWGSDFGFEDPGGAFYSNTEDLMTFGSAILSSRLLSTAATRAWMKPRISTSAPGTQLGAPWEIYRSDNITADKRLIEFYTKGGDVGTYHSLLTLIPDYNITIVNLSAGNETSGDMMAAVTSTIVKILLPELERIGRQDGAAKYAHVYSDAAAQSALTLEVDDGPGLSVKSFVVRGVDILAKYYLFLDPFSIGGPAPPPATVRLYPTDVVLGARQSWRAVFTTQTAEEQAAIDNAVFWKGGSCQTWVTLDRAIYQYKSADEFVFVMEDETVLGVELPAFQVFLGNVPTCSAAYSGGDRK